MLKKNCSGAVIVVTVGIIICVGACRFLGIQSLMTIILSFVGICGGIYISDRQEKKRIKREQDNMFLYLATYLAKAYGRINETLCCVAYSWSRKSTSPCILPSIDKNDFKSFDMQYDISWFPKFQYAISNMNCFVDKNRDNLNLFKSYGYFRAFFGASQIFGNNGDMLKYIQDELLHSNFNNYDKEFLKIYENFLEISKALQELFENEKIKKLFENRKTKELEELLKELKRHETLFITKQETA
jgi:hypothetical protein